MTIACLFPLVYILQVAFLESRYEFMNSVTIQYILHTIRALTSVISLQMMKKKKDNEYSPDGQEIVFRLFLKLIIQ